VSNLDKHNVFALKLYNIHKLLDGIRVTMLEMLNWWNSMTYWWLAIQLQRETRKVYTPVPQDNIVILLEYLKLMREVF